jgi:hypothetical protein
MFRVHKTGYMQVEPEGVERVEELLAWSSQLTDTPLTQPSASQLPRSRIRLDPELFGPVRFTSGVRILYWI